MRLCPRYVPCGKDGSLSKIRRETLFSICEGVREIERDRKGMRDEIHQANLERVLSGRIKS